MRIGIPRERERAERRVALTPESVGRLVKQGLEVVVERDAGAEAGFPDAAYTGAGATLADDPRGAFGGADLVTKVRRPSEEETALMRSGAVLTALLQPGADSEIVPRLAKAGVTALALELVPRITKAQAMDVLSSQSTVAGYKAVLVGAMELGKLLPMLTTAAGTLAPARTFVIGAGVAGLQAIATARRLGAMVSAFDVRPAAREQVQSLGATFVAAELLTQEAEDRGGYARAQTADQQEATRRALAAHVRDQDLVITTAQIPGKPAPRLISKEMVESMRPGSVIVDLAAESGGNCELTRAGEAVSAHGVTVIGPTNLPATIPYHASQMFSRNVETLIKHLVRDGALHIDLEDSIVGPMCVAFGGEVRKM